MDRKDLDTATVLSLAHALANTVTEMMKNHEEIDAMTALYAIFTAAGIVAVETGEIEMFHHLARTSTVERRDAPAGTETIQ